MKILDSKSYCALCNKPLELNNIGAIVKDGSAHNVCQDPCVIEYNKQHRPVKPKEIGTETQNIIHVIPADPFIPPAQEQWHFGQTAQNYYHYIGIQNDEILTIEVTDAMLIDPVELFYETILADQNITKFAIEKFKVENNLDTTIKVTMIRNESIIAVFYCGRHSSVIQDLNGPIIISNNDLIIELKTRNANNNDGPESSVTCKLIGKILQTGPE